MNYSTDCISKNKFTQLESLDSNLILYQPENKRRNLQRACLFEAMGWEGMCGEPKQRVICHEASSFWGPSIPAPKPVRPLPFVNNTNIAITKFANPLSYKVTKMITYFYNNYHKLKLFNSITSILQKNLYTQC
jgi:hypothetical protein